jgi:transcriptional regulator with XRE-family HTH domain
LGERLRILRMDICMSQEELVRVLGKSKTSICAYETNYRKLDIKTLQKLADFFEVSMYYLASRSKVRRLFEDSFGEDSNEDETDKLIDEILDSVQVATQSAVTERKVELLKIIDKVYKNMRGVKVSEKPRGRFV